MKIKSKKKLENKVKKSLEYKVKKKKKKKILKKSKKKKKKKNCLLDIRERIGCFSEQDVGCQGDDGLAAMGQNFRSLSLAKHFLSKTNGMQINGYREAKNKEKNKKWVGHGILNLRQCMQHFSFLLRVRCWSGLTIKSFLIFQFILSCRFFRLHCKHQIFNILQYFKYISDYF